MIFSKAFQIFSCIAAHPEVYDRVRTKDEEISVLPVEVEADIVLGLSDGLLTTSLGMVGEELGDRGELLLSREIFRHTFDQFGHEEQAVAISGVELFNVLLEELPGQGDPKSVLTNRFYDHDGFLIPQSGRE